MRILLVEDNNELGQGLKTLLGATYSVDLVQSGEDALVIPDNKERCSVACRT